MAGGNSEMGYQEDSSREMEQAARLGQRLSPSMIAIDGPAASGKSTVGFRLARDLDFLYFDTGVMYRAVTMAALENGLDVDDDSAVGDLAERLPLDIAPAAGKDADGRQSTVLVDGRDVTTEIRSGLVDRHVSAVSVHERVRTALSRQQRRIGLQYGLGEGDKAGIVMVGRDIGTVVIPEAPVKIYLEATPEERARRRSQELAMKGVLAGYEDVLSDIIRRDEIDSNRSLSPLQIADDASVIDTTKLTVTQVVRLILDILERTVAAQEAD